MSEKHPRMSRSRIQAEIMAGNVFVDGRVADKPGVLYSPSARIELRETENPYVSRGGLKLAGALRDLSVEVERLTVLDVGASTGGFTDCLLKQGARLVYALDVGYGQLDYSLRKDPRVIPMERFNIRDLKTADLKEKPDLAVVDVSFISLTRVLPVLAGLQVPAVLALVKPQFEAGRAEADRGRGVIRDPGLHRRILERTAVFACRIGYCPAAATFSRWPGPKGNIEYFIYLKNSGTGRCNCPPDAGDFFGETVKEAHLELGKN